MPAPRNQPMRSSQRRNSQQDDTPGRTRAGRGGKPTSSRPEVPEPVPPKPSPTKLSPGATRKTTRSASNISGRSFEVAGEVYASYERPLLMVFGLPPHFFETLKKHHGKLPKDRKVLIGSLPLPESALEDNESSDEDEVSVAGSESSEPAVVVQPASRGRGRGRGGRGGSRGRGGRGRGRGRGRGGIANVASPARARSSRTSAPIYSLPEDDEDSDTQGSNIYGNSSGFVTPDLQSFPLAQLKDDNDDDSLEPMEGMEGTDDDVVSRGGDQHVEQQSTGTVKISDATPRGTPSADNLGRVLDNSLKSKAASQTTAKAAKKSAIPKIALQKGSGTQTPRTSASTPAEIAVPKLLDPDEDALEDSDLPGPWIEGAASPVAMECEDQADYLLQTRYKPMIDVQDLITRLAKFTPSQRSSESLYELAENTQYILKAWQDQYLALDARTAPHMHPPKKACNGGRVPLPPEMYEDMKEADLYGYNYDPKKAPGCQDPWSQRPGADKGAGRELRTRRNRDMLDSAAPSEEEAEEEDADGRPAKRQRRATRRFDGTDTGTATGSNTPKKHNGWGGARKKGVSRFAQPTSETPEPESRPAKRARIAATNLLHQRILEMKEASLAPSSGDEESAMDVDEYSDTNVKRGRPVGSKNVARRSDYGIKKGPRKKTSGASTPVPSAHGPNPPPPILQSMVEGQGQFTVDPPASAESTPVVAPTPAENVFQAAPQPSSSHESAAGQVDQSNNPDAYMITAPLSEYTGRYVEETSPASGSRRKPRVKSEKRSQSMTIWWAERKARQREEDEKNGTPTRNPTSRSNSQTGRRGGRVSGASAHPTTPSSAPSDTPRPASMHHPDRPPPAPEAYAAYQPQQPPTAPSPLYMYASAPPQPHPLMLPYSPLAVIPSGNYPYSAQPAPPPTQPQYPARALAPAPIISQQSQATYPSPYGPQSPVSSSRPKSSGQPQRSGPQPLAPAPSHHYSPYPPLSIGRDPFQGMGPGHAVPDARRGSR